MGYWEGPRKEPWKETWKEPWNDPDIIAKPAKPVKPAKAVKPEVLGKVLGKVFGTSIKSLVAKMTQFVACRKMLVVWRASPFLKVMVGGGPSARCIPRRWPP